MFGFSGSFRDLDCFRLLIQRCKRTGGNGNFFDKGSVLPDESIRVPGEGKNETATGVLFPWRQFFVRVNDRFSGSSRDHGWNHLDGFHYSRVGLPLASSKFFGSGLQYVSRFRMKYLHYSQSGTGQQVFIRWSDFVGFSRINGSRFSDLGALRVFPGFLDCTKGFSRFPGFALRFFRSLDKFYF
jgi:hypothetical protein